VIPAGRHNLARPIFVSRSQSVALQNCDNICAVTAEHRRHSSRGHRSGSSHSAATFPHENHGLFGSDDMCGGGGSYLANAVTSSNTDPGECFGGVGEQAQQRHQARSHDEWLSHSRVSNRVLITRGPVRDQIDSGNGAKPAQPVFEVRQLQPRCQEAGDLGALSGGHNRQHGLSLP
jgi:hypothetical protein